MLIKLLCAAHGMSRKGLLFNSFEFECHTDVFSFELFQWLAIKVAKCSIVLYMLVLKVFLIEHLSSMSEASSTIVSRQCLDTHLHRIMYLFLQGVMYVYLIPTYLGYIMPDNSTY